jgi:hypothetical protein
MVTSLSCIQPLESIVMSPPALGVDGEIVTPPSPE